MVRTTVGWVGGVLAALAMGAETTNVVTLPTATKWGGGDTVGSKLIGNTYTAGNGPGLWITSMGGYRVYLNGQMLAWDNQPGRIRFVPLTVLPGANALSVVGFSHGSTPGVLVQLDELDSSHVSSSAWKVSNSPSDNSWKNASFSDAAWGTASATGASTARPDLKVLSGWAAKSSSKWIWSSSSSDTAVVLRAVFKVAPVGFGAATTGGAGGDTVIATTSAAIKAALQSSGAKVILVPEGGYDFRNVRDDANGTYKWCTKACASTDGNPNATYYRVTFDGTCGTGESVATKVNRWETWIPITANKSLIGMGRGAKLRGASIYVRGAESASNAIFRNLAVYDVNPHMVEANDGISTDNTSKVWIDHCSFKWLSDGNDLGGSKGTKEVSVTWSEYDGENHLNCYKYDPYVAMLEDIDVTYAWDSWKNTMGRVPKVVSTNSKSRVHIYGNRYDYNNFFLVGPHGTSSYGAEVLWESNFINNGKGYLTMKGPYGLINAKNNIYSGTVGTFQNENAAGARTTTTEPHDAVFTPPYAYSLPASVVSVPSLLDDMAGIGARWNALPLYTDASVAAKVGPTATLAATAGATAPAALSLTATVAAGGAPVTKVEFWLGDSLLGSDATAPYSFSGKVPAAGNWSVVAIAVDSMGLRSMSAPRSVTVATAVSIGGHESGSSSEVPVMAEVEWLDVQGVLLGHGRVLVDPGAVRVRAPEGMRGVVFASLRLPDGTVRQVRALGVALH